MGRVGGGLLNEELCESPGQLAQMADKEEKVWLVNGGGAFNCETWPECSFLLGSPCCGGESVVRINSSFGGND